MIFRIVWSEDLEARAGDCDAESAWRLAQCLHYGWGTKQNLAGAEKWYLAASDEDKVAAPIRAARESLRALRADMRHAKSAREEARHGVADAQYLLGSMLWNGEGVEKNCDEACQWWEKAAEQGHGKAAFYLAMAFHLGKGVRHDDRKARGWLFLAKRHGERRADKLLRSPWSLRLVHDEALARERAAEARRNNWKG